MKFDRLLFLLLAVAVMISPLSAYAQTDETVEALALESLGEVHGQQELTEDSELVRHGGDNYKSPRAAERFERRQEALRQKLTGRKASNGKVHEVAKGQFVELALERTDRVFVVLVEFGEKAGFIVNPPPPAVQNKLSTVPGPLHNEIAQPNRAVDNSTIWQADYNRAHFVDMYFKQMVDYYRTQSSGRYTFNGDVTEWVKVPFNASRYGSNLMGSPGTWTLIADAINVWTQQQLASGKTIAEVSAYLKTFDQWDRYDYNANGNFNEPDGYIDHFQIVHSGAGEETGGGAQGADAIWSHRWQAWYNRGGVDGPSYNKDGGVEFGGGWGANPTGATAGSSGASLSGAANTTAANVTYAHPQARTGIWVGDYTIQPENGGLGVFAHEYGHDLGLPDHYDTAGGSNGTGYWTIMSSGSYLGDGKDDVGRAPGDFGAWDKLQLGWLNYDQATAGVESAHKLGPAETNTKAAQALVVNLPTEKNVFYLYDPTAGKLPFGAQAWWGGRANSLDTNMTRTINVPAGASALQMRLNYDIEADWDYAYVSVSNNGGASWTNLPGTWPGGANGAHVTLTSNTNNGRNLGHGITGTSGTAWRLASFDMSAYAGQSVQLRIRYKTDEFVVNKGILVDELSFAGFTDGAETGDNGWTLNGFKVTNGVEQSGADHFYIAEFRQYRTYDKGLQTGPYVNGRSATVGGKFVDHYPYQDGLLITYWDSGEADNNTSVHRGEGRVLFVDAHPEPLTRVMPYGGQNWGFAPWIGSVAMYDATFGLEPTDPIRLPFTGTLPPAAGSPAGTPNRVVQFETEYPSLSANPVFNDLNDYWFASRPDSSVIVPKTGTVIRIISTSAQNSFMHIQVKPSGE